MIHFNCPHCAKTINVGDKAAGKKGKCSGCGEIIRVPQITTLTDDGRPTIMQPQVEVAQRQTSLPGGLARNSPTKPTQHLANGWLKSKPLLFALSASFAILALLFVGGFLVAGRRAEQAKQAKQLELEKLELGKLEKEKLEKEKLEKEKLELGKFEKEKLEKEKLEKENAEIAISTQRLVAELDAASVKGYYTYRNATFINKLTSLEELRKSYGVRLDVASLKFDITTGPERLMFEGGPNFGYRINLQKRRAGYTRGMKVIQIIGGSKALVGIGSSTCLAVGWDTTNLVDGEFMVPLDAIVVSGTTEYTTVQGAKSRVYVVEPFDLIKYAADYIPVLPQSIIDVVGDVVKVGDGRRK